MNKNLLFKIAAVILSVVFFLVTLEVGLRATGLKPPKFVTWEAFNTNYSKIYYGNSSFPWSGMFGQIVEYNNIVQNNSLSFHDSEHSFEKSPDVYRILFLGDSFVESLQVPLEETFFKILERELNSQTKVKLSKKIEVIAIARSGMGAIREYEHLKDLGIKYSPDLVVCLFTSQNDFKDDLTYFASKQIKNDNPGAAQASPAAAGPNQNTLGDIQLYEKLSFIKHSYLNRWIAFRFVEMKRQPRIRKNLAQIYKSDFGVFNIDNFSENKASDPLWKAGYQLTGKNYIQMNELCKTNNARFLAVFIDNPFVYQEELPKRVYQLVSEFKDKLDFNLPITRLKSLFKFYKIKFFDLNEGFAKEYARSKNSGHFVYDGHWNKRGHLLTASLFEEYFLKNDLRILTVAKNNASD